MREHVMFAIMFASHGADRSDSIVRATASPWLSRQLDRRNLGVQTPVVASHDVYVSVERLGRRAGAYTPRRGCVCQHHRPLVYVR